MTSDRFVFSFIVLSLWVLFGAVQTGNAQTSSAGKQADEIETVLISSTPGSSTQTGNGETFSGVASDDGRYVAYASTSSNLGFTDGNTTQFNGEDVFLLDRQTGDLSLVSHAANQPGVTNNSHVSFPQDISANGRYVLFSSKGTNLIAGQNDLNGSPTANQGSTDLFLFDIMTNETVLVSHAFGSTTTTGNEPTGSGRFSPDGRFILFASGATNLIDGFTDTNGEFDNDIYIYEVATGEISLISHAPGQTTVGSDGQNREAVSSHDGRYVAWESEASNLVDGYVDGSGGAFEHDVFLQDRMTGETVLVSHIPGAPTTGGNEDSEDVEISSDGRYLVFNSEANNLVAGQTGPDTRHTYLWDRETNTMKLVSHAAGSPTTASDGFAGGEFISSDGTTIVYTSSATDIVSGQVDENGRNDIFLYDMATGTNRLVSRKADAPATTADDFSEIRSVSADGRFVLFNSRASNIIEGQVDSNNSDFSGRDAFLYDALTGVTTLLSNVDGSPTTTDAGGSATAQSMTPDGSVALFSSMGSAYVSGLSDSNGEDDLFLSVIDTSLPGCDFTVSNTNSFGVGSLPQAIFDANNQAGKDTICFAIDGDGPHTIRPSFALPTITDPLVIDGTTQAGASCDAWPPELMIEIDGSIAGPSTNGLNFEAGSDGSTVRGLVINRFSWSGINSEVDDQVYQCNFMGTDVTGMVDLGNGGDGFRIDGGSNVLIGGTGPGEQNLTSGNGDDGIDLISGSSDAIVQGNIVGLNVTGTSALPNDDVGVRVQGTGHVVGGPAAAARNLISANGWVGVYLTGEGTADNRIEGNYIGTDVTGLVDLGNVDDGVLIDRGSSNTIGGEETSAGNVISGNGDDGVDIFGEAAMFNSVTGNLIGVGADGSTPLGNVEDGIDLNGAPSFTEVADNVLAANGEWGLYINSGTSDTQVYRNYVGTNAAGDELGNGFGGILVEDSGPQIIGGTYGDAGECCEGNTIAYNGGPGIGVDVIQAISHEKGLRGNRIFSNDGLGIDLELDGVTANDPGDADGAGAANALQNYPVLDVPQSGQTFLTGLLNSVSSSSFRVDVYRSATCDPSGYGEGEVFLGTVSVETDASGNAPITFELGVQTGPGEFYTATAIDAQANTSEFSTCVEPEPPVDAPPSASEITAPVDGATVMVGGTGPDDAADPNDTIAVNWTASVDPEGADVTHTWQLSASDSFSELLIEVNAGADTEITFTLAELAAVLDGAGVEVGAGISAYHRVISGDGTHETIGPVAEATLVRGTLIGEVDMPPSASELVSPADGARVVVGGTVPANATDPGATQTFTWEASVDPEGSAVTHIWQLSLDESFSELLLEFDAGPEIDASFTVGELAPILDDAGLVPGVEVTAWHRVLSTDGINETIGPAFEVRILRGTITSTDTAGETPAEYVLRAAYPNPFNPSTTIGYALPESGQVRLGVFDLLGREVRVLVDGMRPAGDHMVVFEAGVLPSGIYLIRMEAGGRALTRQVTLMK